MTLEMTPITPGGAEFTGTDVPSFIQIQADGTNLGEPTVSTLNFGIGMTATRGTGGNANKVTVTADGGVGGGTPKLYLFLEGTDDASSKFNRDLFTNWTGEVLVASDDAAWNQSTHSIDIVTPGYYEFRIRGLVEPDRFGTGDWPGNITVYGVTVITEDWGDQSTLYTRNENGSIPGTSGNAIAQWSDVVVVPIYAAGPAQVALFAEAYDSARETLAKFSCEVVVERVGDAPTLD